VFGFIYILCWISKETKECSVFGFIYILCCCDGGPSQHNFKVETRKRQENEMNKMEFYEEID